MVICAVYGCSNSEKNNVEGKTISFYRFPKDPEYSEKWANACRRKDYINIKYAKICSIHFQPHDYVRSLKHELLHYSHANARKLKEDAIPTQNLYVKTTIDPGMPI